MKREAIADFADQKGPIHKIRLIRTTVLSGRWTIVEARGSFSDGHVLSKVMPGVSMGPALGNSAQAL